jgi:hypothetical protein
VRSEQIRGYRCPEEPGDVSKKNSRPDNQAALHKSAGTQFGDDGTDLLCV